MDNEINPTNPVKPTASMDGAVKGDGMSDKPKAKAKPLIEGINTPKSTNDVLIVKPNSLTQEEKDLISASPIVETKPSQIQQKPLNDSFNIMPQRPKRNFLRWFIVIVFLAALVFLGYKLYKDYYAKNSAPVVIDPNSVAPASSPNYDQTQQTESAQQPATSSASSTLNAPFDLAGGNVPSTTPVVNAPQTSLKINSTPTGFLNVRSLPSSAGKIIAKVYPGETYPYTKMQNSWYDITLTNGQSGWVSGQYVTVK